MQQPGAAKIRPMIPGRSCSAHGSRGVHLQHLDAADATRDAHIAAGMAFYLNQERLNADAPETGFPRPQPGALVRIRRSSDDDGNCPPLAVSFTTLPDKPPQRDSIRFVRRGGRRRPDTTAGPDQSRPAICLTHGTCQMPHRIAAPSDVHPALRNSAASDSNYSQYTSSLPNTPINRQRLNKTWSASELRNNENYNGPSSTAFKARNTLHVNTTPPRRTALSQRHWSRPGSRSSMCRKSTTTSSTDDAYLRSNKDWSYSPANPYEQVACSQDAHANTDHAVRRHDSSDMQSIAGKLPPFTVSPLETIASANCPQRNNGFSQVHQQMAVGVTTIPPPCPITSRSFLRSHPKRDFSFSSHDDDKFTAVKSNAQSLQKRLSLHTPANETKSMRKSLRKKCPQTPSPKENLAAQDTEVNAADTEKGLENEISKSGSLRKTASRMSKRVKMRLRSFWSHSKSESSTDQIPEQHIEARSHLSILSGQQYMSEREGRLSNAQGMHTGSGSEGNETGTVVYGARQSRSGDNILRSEYGGDSSRFTSWSSSTRRTSSNASNRQQAADLRSEHLPVISENAGQPEASIFVSKPGLEAAGRPQSCALAPPGKAQTNLADRDKILLASGIRLQQDRATSPESSCESSTATSSPSLASSGRGGTPRQAVAPDALRRLQNLTSNLQKACREEKGAIGHYPAHFDEYSDPFYDGDRKLDVLYAFQSAPATPFETSPAGLPNLSSTVKSQMTATPQYFFRGKSPFRRALQESIKAFEGETSALRGQRQEDFFIVHDSPNGGIAPEQAEVACPRSSDDDAPLLNPNGARQWSRVQA